MAHGIYHLYEAFGMLVILLTLVLSVYRKIKLTTDSASVPPKKPRVSANAARSHHS